MRPWRILVGDARERLTGDAPLWAQEAPAQGPG